MKEKLKQLYFDLGYHRGRLVSKVKAPDDFDDLSSLRLEINRVEAQIIELERKYESPLYEALDGKEGE